MAIQEAMSDGFEELSSLNPMKIGTIALYVRK